VGSSGRAVAAALLAAAILPVLAPATAVTAATAAAVPPARNGVPSQDCPPQVGQQLTSTPWPQTRLKFQNAWPISQGDGVRVGVVDSGLDPSQPQVGRMHVADGHNVRPGENPQDWMDCYGHGTGVSSIIAAPQLTGVPFVGVAPGATIIPIKQTGRDPRDGDSDGIAAGIRYAVQQHARVVNVSVKTNAPTAAMEQAVAYAAQQQVVIVAAAGNDAGESDLKAAAYPAAYAARYDNVIAVAAVDQQDTVAAFSDAGGYVSVAAPGVGVIIASRGSGYAKQDGTSFAAPFVTGTVALLLGADPAMTPAQVRTRLEATADPPPVSVPSERYGYGIINPYRALTAVRNDALTPPTPAAAAPLPAPSAPVAADRRLQHVALGAGLGLVALAALLAAGAAVLRRARTDHADRAARPASRHRVRSG